MTCGLCNNLYFPRWASDDCPWCQDTGKVSKEKQETLDRLNDESTIEDARYELGY